MCGHLCQSSLLLRHPKIRLASEAGSTASPSIAQQRGWDAGLCVQRYPRACRYFFLQGQKTRMKRRASHQHSTETALLVPSQEAQTQTTQPGRTNTDNSNAWFRTSKFFTRRSRGSPSILTVKSLSRQPEK